MFEGDDDNDARDGQQKRSILTLSKKVNVDNSSSDVEHVKVGGSSRGRVVQVVRKSKGRAVSGRSGDHSSGEGAESLSDEDMRNKMEILKRHSSKDYQDSTRSERELEREKFASLYESTNNKNNDTADGDVGESPSSGELKGDTLKLSVDSSDAQSRTGEDDAVSTSDSQTQDASDDAVAINKKAKVVESQVDSKTAVSDSESVGEVEKESSVDMESSDVEADSADLDVIKNANDVKSSTTHSTAFEGADASAGADRHSYRGKSSGTGEGGFRSRETSSPGTSGGRFDRGGPSKSSGLPNVTKDTSSRPLPTGKTGVFREQQESKGFSYRDRKGFGGDTRGYGGNGPNTADPLASRFGASRPAPSKGRAKESEYGGKASQVDFEGPEINKVVKSTKKEEVFADGAKHWKAVVDGSGEDERIRVRELFMKRRERKRGGRGQKISSKVMRIVIVPDKISVTDLARQLAIKVAELKRKLKASSIDFDSGFVEGDDAQLFVTDLGHECRRHCAVTVNSVISGFEDNEESLKTRPPVVTVMGHVDHGKTSLLDALCNAKVAEGEAGGITQKIGAFQTENAEGHKITFVDTPGHEAFTMMRARGANVTDIVVLVVAADDGVMQQTVEAISHARAAGVPIIVAINKIDKNGADPTRVINDLLQHEIIPESLGGDVMCVEVSATKALNLDLLRDTILLQADVMALVANSDRVADGIVLESSVDDRHGVKVSIMVRGGTLKEGDILVAGCHYGNVRYMLDSYGKKVKVAGPSTPVEIVGFSVAPEAGERFVVVDTEKKAKEMIQNAKQLLEDQKDKDKQADAAGFSFDSLFAAKNNHELQLVIKAATQGAVEAVAHLLQGIDDEKIKITILHKGIGNIGESDVLLADVSKAIILGFEVHVDNKATILARSRGITIKTCSVIYDALDFIKASANDILEPVFEDKYLGTMSVRSVFNKSRSAVGGSKVAGCYITDGVIKRGAKAVVHRGDKEVFSGKIRTIRHFDEDKLELTSGFECGIMLHDYEGFFEGDVVKVYEVIEIKRTV